MNLIEFIDTNFYILTFILVFSLLFSILLFIVRMKPRKYPYEILEFVGKPHSKIPVGTEIHHSNNFNYITIREATISETGRTHVEVVKCYKSQ